MAIYITGDTHGGLNEKKLYNKNFPNYKDCTKHDYLIIAGDFGYIWDNSEKEKNLRKALDSRKYSVLFVDGNHENYDLLEKYPIINKFGGKVRQIEKSIYQLMRGEVYIIDGHKIFTFGGATSTDKEHRISNVDWWERETFNYDEMNNAFDNLEKHNYEVDIIITHTCATSTLEYLCEYYNKYLEEFDAHNRLFEEIKYRVKFKKWYFGHLHLDLEMKTNEIVIFENIIKVEK